MSAARVLVVTLAAGVVAACLGRTVDLGDTVDRADAGPATGPAPDASPSVLEAGASPFGACTASGRIDRVYTARDLVERLVGSWAQCPGVVASPLPCAPSTPLWGIRFSADGAYTLIGATSELGPWTDQPETCGRGTFRIYSPSQPDGGLEGGVGTYVALDDTRTRNGLEVHLVSDDGVLDVELVDFEIEPRRLFLREQGPLPSSGYFAPVAASPR